MNTIEELELPDWPPIAVGAVILAIGVLLCVVGLCRVVTVSTTWCWKKLNKEPRTDRG